MKYIEPEKVMCGIMLLILFFTIFLCVEINTYPNITYEVYIDGELHEDIVDYTRRPEIYIFTLKNGNRLTVHSFRVSVIEINNNYKHINDKKYFRP